MENKVYPAAKKKLGQRRRAYLDLETTGLSPETHEILEVAVVYDDGSPDVIYRIKPEHLETASPEALKINGFTKEGWCNALPAAKAAPLIAKALEGCVIVGHNVKFDIGFLEALFRNTGIKSTLGYHHVDTCTLAYVLLVPYGLESVSLSNVCSFLGMEPEGIHLALGGATRCREVYSRLTKATWLDKLKWKLRRR